MAVALAPFSPGAGAARRAIRRRYRSRSRSRRRRFIGDILFFSALLLAFAGPRERTRIGRFQVDDVAEKDFPFVQFVAPDDDGLEG